ncbi:Mastigoneme [Phytophthora megakarya]|uniref:Mastigoneme n=1 Tax=Phytophthora megakarya TaxID=4795 RepID=A0A225W7V0_9STRA|nr:Mastigoneme [Phytophthora megakarya]
MQNWMYGDCSGRQCPYTRAWHDTAQANNDAHYYAECGNRGTCDRVTGECLCDAGFTGSGCRRMQCPTDCSGHGTCEFIEELATDTYHKKIKGTSGRTYTLWDQEKIMGCVCDAGFEGHDCSLRTCAKGDDPLTPNQVDMIQAIAIDQTAGGQGFLTYYDPYGNAYTTEKFTIASGFASTTCDNIQIALQRLPNNVLNNVQVSALSRFYSFTRLDPTDYVIGSGTIGKVFNDAGTNDLNAGPTNKVICEVQFPSGPGTTGYQNLLGCDVADHSTSVGYHPKSSGVASGTCTVYEVFPQFMSVVDANSDSIPDNQIAAGTIVQRPLTELAECSGRGSCDYSTGTCVCYAGHMGLACQKQEALV